MKLFCLALQLVAAYCATEYTTSRYQSRSWATHCVLPSIQRKNIRQASKNRYVRISNHRPRWYQGPYNGRHFSSN